MSLSISFMKYFGHRRPSNWGTLAAPFCPSDNGVSSTKRPYWKRGDCEVRQNRWWIFGISWIDGFRHRDLKNRNVPWQNPQKCTIRYNVHSFLANANSTTSYVKNKSSCLNWHPNHHQLLSFPTGDGRNLMGIFQWNLQPFVQQFSSMKLPPRQRLALCLGYVGRKSSVEGWLGSPWVGWEGGNDRQMTGLAFYRDFKRWVTYIWGKYINHTNHPRSEETCFAFRSAEGLVYLFRLSSNFTIRLD